MRELDVFYKRINGKDFEMHLMLLIIESMFVTSQCHRMSFYHSFPFRFSIKVSPLDFLNDVEVRVH